MANRNNMLCIQDPEICDLRMLSEKPTEVKLEFPLTVAQDALDLSCKSQAKLSILKDVKDPYPSLISTTSDQCKEANISITKKHSFCETNVMSPDSVMNPPKKRKIVSTAVDNEYDKFTTNYTPNVGSVVSPIRVMPDFHPHFDSSHLPSSSETISETVGIPRDAFPTSSSMPASFAHQSFPVSDARIIPQRFPMLQSAVSLSGKSETPTSLETHMETMKKMMRPFKAYPKDSMCFDKEEQDRYMQFRDRLLQSVKDINESPNPKMRRTSKSPALPNSTVDEKDNAYWERRRKNNAAAKRSRDARRAKEDELAIKAAFLQNENHILRNEVQYMRNICMFYSTDVLRERDLLFPKQT